MVYYHHHRNCLISTSQEVKLTNQYSHQSQTESYLNVFRFHYSFIFNGSLIIIYHLSFDRTKVENEFSLWNWKLLLIGRKLPKSRGKSPQWSLFQRILVSLPPANNTWNHLSHEVNQIPYHPTAESLNEEYSKKNIPSHSPYYLPWQVKVSFYWASGSSQELSGAQAQTGF